MGILDNLQNNFPSGYADYKTYGLYFEESSLLFQEEERSRRQLQPWIQCQTGRRHQQGQYNLLLKGKGRRQRIPIINILPHYT